MPPTSIATSSYPLSWQQEWLWLHVQVDPQSAVYNNPIGVRLQGPLDLDAFARAIESLVQRHDVLRYVFQTTEQGITQTIGDAVAGRVIVEQLRSADTTALEREALDGLLTETRRPFDLASGPPFRARVLRGGDAESWAVLTLHHLISDAWSVRLLVNELRDLYLAHANRSPLPPARARQQYGEYALWQRSSAGPDAARSGEFWRSRFGRAQPILLGDRAVGDAGFAGDSHPIWLPSALVSRLQASAASQRTTPFALLLTALVILLQRYSRETTIAVWVPMAGRTRLGLESIVGLFAVTLPIVVEVSNRTTVDELVQTVSDELMAAQDHQALPYDTVMADTGAHRIVQGSGQVMCSYNPLPDPPSAVAGLQIVPISLDTATAKCDFELNLWRAVDGVRGRVEYRRGAFSPGRVSGIATNWIALVEALLERPRTRVDELPLVTEAARAQLVQAAHGPIRASRALSWIEMFVRQVERMPTAVAVEDDRQSLTYAELHRKSSALAYALTAVNAGVDTVVSICLPRSTDFLVAMVGVFKAGAAYVPIEPSLPVARRAWLRSAAGSRIVIGRPDTLEDLRRDDARKHYQSTIVAVDIDAVQAGDNAAGDDAPTAVAPNQLAYVIFTSGSTGTPKGAMVEHGGMTNHLLAKIEDLALTGDDVVAQTASSSFDISVWQFLAPLAIGARVHIVADEIVREASRLLHHVDRHGITVLETVPSMMRAMLDTSSPACARLRWLISTGETLAADLAALWFDRYPAVRLMNAYGPTECSDDVTHAIVADATNLEGGTVPIGRPVRNLSVHVLDERLEPVPAGIPGALYVGGVGVGRGYIGDPGRTAEAFLPDPFACAAGARLYRTGDLARVDANGSIEFMGRIDRQVKIRGFRVEPGEIEAHLLMQPSVSEAAVVVAQLNGGDPALIAYVAGADGRVLDAAELHSTLRAQVPAYLVPNAVVTLEALPRTVTGKVDRTALELRPLALDRPRVLPRTDAERTLAAIWEELLGISAVGVHEDFFESGGNSLSATRMLARITARFGVTLSLRAVFEAPTIAQLVARIVSARAAEVDSSDVDALVADLEREAHL